jgi:aryl-alcohol dehydrogenase-like predicted oxidoreductase
MSVSASRLTLGTMRFSADRHTVEQWARFLIEAHDIGIRSLHVSNEYESWPLFLESLAIARKASSDIDFRFIAKLGEPHFNHPSFDAKRLEQHVERYCLKLGIERLEDIQWMWRADLDQDGKRCADFVGQADSIRTCIERLKRNGRIGRFLCFPYSPSFATQALDFEFFDGLTVYRNAQERDYETHLDQCQMKSKIAHIIRPFRAGATLTDQNLNPQQQLIQALDHPAVETAILSTGNMAHLHDLLI